MADLIARVLHAVCAWLFPATGTHRAATPPTATRAATPHTAPVTSPRPHRRPLLPHKSPYAAEAAANRPLVDTTSSVRPYLDMSHKERTTKQQAQAERLWILDMATRGIDVGPSVIHGVHIGAGSRTVRVGVAA